MASSSDGAILGAVVMAMILMSAFIGVVNYTSIYGEFPDFNSDTLPGQIQVNVQGSAGSYSGSTLSDINFTSGYDYGNQYETYGYGTWENTSSGLELVDVGLLNFITDKNKPSIILKGVNPSTPNVYTVDTVVDNVPDAPFFVYPRFYIGPSVLAGQDIRVKFDSQGIHVQSQDASGVSSDSIDVIRLQDGWTENYLYEIPNAQTTLPDGSVIHTVLTEATSDQDPAYLQVCKDGQCYFYIDVWNAYEIDVIAGSTGQFLGGYSHAGAGSETEGFIIKGFPATTVTRTSSESDIGETGIWFIDAITSALDTAATILGEFGMIFGAFISFEPGAIMPAWASALILTSFICVIVYLGLKIARGGG